MLYQRFSQQNIEKERKPDMRSEPNEFDFSKDGVYSETIWKNLYRKLQPYIRKFVYRHRFSLSKGQENDVIEDLLQEAVIRVFKYVKRAAEGHVAPIDSIERFGYTIALNVCRDWWRKERHALLCQSLDEGVPEDALNRDWVLNPEEVALNLVYQEWIFMKVARDIARFPQKTRRALLIELAERTFFDDEPTPLQKAFLQQGIRLADYQRLKPTDPKLRSRHNSLANQAFSRVKTFSYR
jgi:DNA-directed RNA polymerase specialized sigma24 family protein